FGSYDSIFFPFISQPVSTPGVLDARKTESTGPGTRRNCQPPDYSPQSERHFLYSLHMPRKLRSECCRQCRGMSYELMENGASLINLSSASRINSYRRDTAMNPSRA
ncbi:hypothetical protein WG66_007267, partial [Moniliophthora roreri]